MCLSSVYSNNVSDDTLILENVQKMEFQNGTIILTDIMERQVSIEGEIIMANLVDGRVIIAPKDL